MKHIYKLLGADGAILNTIVADEAFVTEHHAGRFELVGAAPEGPMVAVSRHIAVGSFFDRFGTSKWAILADTAPLVQALVRDCSARRYIDLDRPDLVQALQLLVQAGHEVDAEAILGGAIRPEELP